MVPFPIWFRTEFPVCILILCAVSSPVNNSLILYWYRTTGLPEFHNGLQIWLMSACASSMRYRRAGSKAEGTKRLQNKTIMKSRTSCDWFFCMKREGSRLLWLHIISWRRLEESPIFLLQRVCISPVTNKRIRLVENCGSWSSCCFTLILACPGTWKRSRDRVILRALTKDQSVLYLFIDRESLYRFVERNVRAPRLS